MGSQLPTYEDVIRCCLHEKRCIGSESGGSREPPFSAIANAVTKKLETIYIKASIPIVTHTRIVQMIHMMHITPNTRN